MAFDALEALRQAGNPLEMINDAQRQVLASLSEEEVATLNSVKARMDAVSGEVTGQTADNGYGIY